MGSEDNISELEFVSRLNLIESAYDELFDRIFDHKQQDEQKLLDTDPNGHECDESCGRRALYVISLDNLFEDYRTLVLENKPLGFEEKEDFVREFEYKLIDGLETVKNNLVDQRNNNFDKGVKQAFKKVRSDIHSITDNLNLKNSI